ncbi:cytochrome C and Quinol oxidase polypeptide I family protein, partial [Vibrio parahaemolyticus V-223/04]
LPHR